MPCGADTQVSAAFRKLSAGCHPDKAKRAVKFVQELPGIGPVIGPPAQVTQTKKASIQDVSEVGTENCPFVINSSASSWIDL